MSTKSIALRVLIKKFQALGYDGPYSGGRHQFMVKGPHKIRIPNPHGTREVHISLLREILRQANIPFDVWERASKASDT